MQVSDNLFYQLESTTRVKTKNPKLYAFECVCGKPIFRAYFFPFTFPSPGNESCRNGCVASDPRDPTPGHPTHCLCSHRPRGAGSNRSVSVRVVPRGASSKIEFGSVALTPMVGSSKLTEPLRGTPFISNFWLEASILGG